MVLAAGNVTSAMPCTVPAAYTTPVSRRSAIARCTCQFRRARCQPLLQMLTYAERVGHRRQRRIDRADAREEARVDDIQVVQLVRLAIRIEHRRLWIAAKATRAGLVRAAADFDVVLHVHVA